MGPAQAFGLPSDGVCFRQQPESFVAHHQLASTCASKHRAIELKFAVTCSGERVIGAGLTKRIATIALMWLAENPLKQERLEPGKRTAFLLLSPIVKAVIRLEPNTTETRGKL